MQDKKGGNMNKAELDQQIRQAPNGKSKMELLRKGWEMADQNKDYDGQITYRMEYMHEAVFYDDVLEIYIIFPEILKLHDQHMKEYGHDPYTRNIMWRYKWLLENAMDFYQISVKQYEMFWQDCKKRFVQNNYSLRPLYEYRFIFYANIDAHKAAEGYREFWNCKRDMLSDCHACERAREVNYLLGIGDFQKASEWAEPLINGILSCAEEPECTLGYFLRYYNGKILEGDHDYAEPAGDICETLKKRIAQKGIATAHIPDVFMYYALENPTKALNYYKKHWSFFEKNRNPENKFRFALAVLAFLYNLKDKTTYKMTLDSSFPFYNENNIYDVEVLRAYYRDKALDIARKMDARNGTCVFYDAYQKCTMR